MASTQLAQSVEFLSSSGLLSTQTCSSNEPNSWQLLDCWTPRLALQNWTPPIETCFYLASHFGALDWRYVFLWVARIDAWLCLALQPGTKWARGLYCHILIPKQSELRILEVTSCRELVFIKVSRPTTTNYIAEDAWKQLQTPWKNAQI